MGAVGGGGWTAGAVDGVVKVCGNVGGCWIGNAAGGGWWGEGVSGGGCWIGCGKVVPGGSCAGG